MIKHLSLSSNSKSRVFFYSDIHYCHDPNWLVPIWKSRGYNSAKECDDNQVYNWNQSITNDDTVFLLGDTVLGAGRDSLKIFNFLLNTLNYKELYIMPGNHYAGFKQIFLENLNILNKIDEYYRLSIKINESKICHFIPNYYEIFVNGKAIVLSHYPLLSWNGMSKGSWHLFGHEHNNMEKHKWIKDNYLIGKCLSVTPEKIKKPISFNEVEVIMNNSVIVSTDHHSESTSTPFSGK